MELKSKKLESIIKNKAPLGVRLAEAKLKNQNKHKPTKYEGLSKEEIIKMRRVLKLVK